MNAKSGKVAVVTGANRGIGFETCRQLSQLGVTTILTSRDEGKGKLATEKLKEEGNEVIYHQLDVADDKSIARLKTFVVAGYRRCDILVNNAGVFFDRSTSIFDLDEETLQETLRINFLGPLKMCQVFIPLMRENRYGRVVNVSSGMGSISSMDGRSAAYKLSKLMMNGMTRIMAGEMDSVDIKINTMSPGWVHSDMGGANAPRSLSKGADTITWLATLPLDGPSGGFFEDRQQIPW